MSSRPPKRTLRAPKRVRRFFRPQLEPLEDRVFPALLTVFSLLDNDGVNPAAFAGTGTLRQAIIDANANVGADVIQFQLPGSGTRVINVLSELPTITESVLIDGYTQAGSAVATANSAATLNVRINNAATSPINGLVIDGTDTTVRGLMITGFNQGEARGIDVYGSGHVIAGNFIGTDGVTTPSTVSQSNNYGVVLEWNAHDNRVGGTTPADRNIISGNRDGIWLYGGDNYNNVVEGNYIGLDRTGTLDFGNQWRGMVVAYGAHDNTIGGSTPATRNVISGNNDKGILLYGTSTQNNVVAGNYIGLNAAGTGAVGNGNAGVAIEGGASDNVIGGTADKPGTGLGNVISGNTDQGIWILNSGSERNRVEGNLIGLNPAGTSAISNGNLGIYIAGGAAHNIIGGSAQGTRNIISGNNAHGILLQDMGTDGNVIAGNFIGTDIAGASRVQNNAGGIAVAWGAKDTLIGTNGDGVGDEFERNVISGSIWENILVVGVGTDRTVIAGNYIGLNAAGTAAITNGIQGITVRYGAKNTRIGTDGSDDAFNANERNVISGNNGSGIVIQTTEWNGDLPADGSTTDGTWIAGNYIGTDATGMASIQNAGDGVTVLSGATNTVIGTNGNGSGDAIEGNVISGNRGQGVYVGGANTSGTRIAGNIIGLNVAGQALPNDSGVWLDNGAIYSIIGSNNDGVSDSLEGNTIANQRWYGIYVSGATTRNNRFSRNSISSSAVAGIDWVASSVQNAPILNAPTGTGATRTVTGTLSGTANTSFRIEFFSNATIDANGNAEGQIYLGSTTTNSDGSGNASFSFDYAYDPRHPFVTATATNLTTGETSKFSLAKVRTFLVTNANASGPGSLRQAILDANATPNFGSTPDRIAFAISGSGVQSITGSLPEITDAVFIDGYSQTGATMATSTAVANLTVKLDGNGLSFTTGTNTSASGSTVRGFMVLNAGINLWGVSNVVIQGNFVGTTGTSSGNFSTSGGGVSLTLASDNLIGGSTPAERNIISGNGTGIYGDFGVTNNVISGNYIGTNAAGNAAIGNSVAINLIGSFGDAGGNRIGGSNPGEGNVISGNLGSGNVNIGLGTAGNIVQGNYIGLNAAGTGVLGNNAPGITAGGLNTIIGGSTPGARNVITGNASANIWVRAGGAVIQGNYIGTNADGSLGPFGNPQGLTIFYGILIQPVIGSGYTIGGSAPGQGNLIVGGWNAVYLSSTGTFRGNRIGVGGFGSSINGTQGGIYIAGGTHVIGGLNPGEGNTIFGASTTPGITVAGNAAAEISGNTISNNNGLGIEIGGVGVTPNDLGDLDTGDNGLQNFPVLTQAVVGSDGVLRIQGTLNSLANRGYRIEFFGNYAADNFGNGEGQRFLGSTDVSTNASGDASFDYAVTGAIGSLFFLSATATDITAHVTSEFAQTIPVQFASSAQTYDQLVLRDVPIAYWRLDDASGSVATDASLNGNNGQYAGPSIRLNANSIVSTATDHAAAFFGYANNPGAVVLPSSVFGFPNTTTRTFETWFQTAPGGSGVILGQVGAANVAPQGGGFGGYVPAIYVDSSGVVRSEVFWHGGINQNASAAGYNDGRAHHLVVVYDNGTETLFLDGAAVSTRSGLGQFGYAGTYTYFLGTGYTPGWPNGNNGWYDFQGTLDETAVYTTALTASQIRAHYAVGTGLFDYGNSPEYYPTRVDSDGARHIPIGPTLGTARTAETNGPSDSADNDGVTLPELVAVAGSQAVLTVSHTGGKVDAWIDFNADGDWDDPGEQVLTDAVGSGSYLVTVPTDVRSGTTWARFRVSSAGGLTPTGLAADGEVEDYEIVIHGINVGDAPGYAEAIHGAVGGMLGVLRNEIAVSPPGGGPGGVFDFAGFGGVTLPPDDDDGIDFGIAAIPLVAGRQWDVRVSAPNGGYVNGWIDFNQDGVFSAGERIIADAWGYDGSIFAFELPSDALLGTTWARFRVSSQYGVGPDGFAPDGEVEDYEVTFVDPTTISRDLVVTNTDDHGVGSLRYAMQLANLLPGHDDIRFDIPEDQAQGGQFVIAVQSPLPYITESVTIDGRTQAGFDHQPIVRIENSGFDVFADNVVLRSMQADRVFIEGNDNAIYGMDLTRDGLRIEEGFANRIGGPGADERNYLSYVSIYGNSDTGDIVTGETTIQGNWIGFGIDAQPLPGGFGGIGIWDSHANIIGGSNPGEGNWILSNDHYWDGSFDSVRAIGLFNSDDNIIAGNRINVDSAGQPIFGLDDAIEVSWYSSGNIIGGTEAGAGNIIASDEVAVTGPAVILGNSIVQGYQGPYAIDSSEAAPVLSTPSVLPNGNSRVAGTLEGTPFSSYRIEFFANDADHLGSAQIYLGFVDLNVTSTDGVGEFTFDYAPIPGFRWITATATRNNSGPTSRISDAVRDDNNSSTSLTNLFLDNRFVDANQDAGAFVGSFFLPNGLDPSVHSFELVGGEGDDGNGIFEIVDNRLYANSDLSPYPGDTYSIRVRTTNSDGDSFERIFVIVLTDAPEPLDTPPPPVVPPEVPGEGTIYVAEDVASGSTVEYIGSSTPPLNPPPDGGFYLFEDAGVGTYAYELESFGWYYSDGYPTQVPYVYFLSGDSPFYVEGNWLVLGDTLDFETQNEYHFTVYREPGIEDPWHAIENYNDAFASFDMTFAVADVYEFVNLNWSSDGPFSLVYQGGAFSLVYNSDLGPLNYETANQYYGELTLDDGTLWREYDIRITNVNEPIQEIYLDDNVIPEAVDGYTDYVVGVLSGWDPDGETDFYYSIVDDPSGAFGIDGNQLIVSNPYALDFESSWTHQVTIIGYDSGGTSVERTFEITVRNVNEAISSISLDGDQGDAFADAGTYIGSIDVSDPDVYETFTYEITDPNGYFAVDDYGNVSFATDSVAPGDYVVTIRAYDTHGSSLEADVTIYVQDTLGPPSANDDSLTVRENQQLEFDVFENDNDPAGGGLTIIDYSNPTHGQLELGASGFIYRPAEFYVGSDSFQYTFQDARGLTATATVYLSVVGTLSFSGPSNYEVLWSGILYFDADPVSDSYESADLTLLQNNHLPSDAYYEVTLTILNYWDDVSNSFASSSIGPDGFGTQQTVTLIGAYDEVVAQLEATHLHNNAGGIAQLYVSAAAYDANTGDLLANGSETRTVTPVSRDRYLSSSLGWYISEDVGFDFSNSYDNVPDPYHFIGYNHYLQIAANDVASDAMVDVRAYLVGPNGVPTGSLDDGSGLQTELVYHGTLAQANAWLASLAFAPPANFGSLIPGEQVQLWVELSAVNDFTGDLQIDQFRRDFTIGPVADTPAFSADPVSGSVGQDISLQVQGELADTDGSESLWFDLFAADLPAGVELRLGGVALDASSPYYRQLFAWRLPADQLVDLTVYSPDAIEFELLLRAVAIESQPLAWAYSGTNPGEAPTSYRTMLVTIGGDNSAPIANNDEIGGSEDQPISGNVLDNDSDPDGDSLIVDAQSIDALNGGHVELLSDGSFVYTPAANYFGSDSFTYTVRDDFGHASQAMVTLTISAVNDSPVLADDAYSGSEDTPITGGALDNDSDIDGDVIHAVAGTIATAQGGVVELREDGSFTYTPATNFHGEDSFVYQATDGVSESVWATVTLTVASVNDDPTANDDSASGDEDSTITGSVLDNDTDADGDTLAVDADSFDTALGGHVEFSADGSFVYTPTANYFGSDSFTYIVRDGNGGVAQATVYLDVVPVNDAPEIVGDAFLGSEDATIRGNVLGNDFDIDGDALYVEAGTFTTAQGGVVEIQADGSFVYTPAENFHGEDSFVYRASDGIADWGEGTVLLTVESVNDDPVANDDSFQSEEDEPLTGNVLDNDTDADGDVLRAVSGTIATDAGGSVEIFTDGSFIYTPPADFHGDDHFVYTATDGNGAYAHANVTIAVASMDDAPVAVDDEYFGDEDQTISGNMLSNDFDVDLDPLFVAFGTFTTEQGGQIDVSSDGSFTYTPAANFFGDDRFVYSAIAGEKQATGAVVFHVASINDDPIAADDSFSGDEDGQIADDVLTNDSDADGDSLAVDSQSIDTANGGHLELNSDGSFVYTPAANYFGSDSFTYIVRDGAGGYAQATVYLDIASVNDAPVAVNDAANTDEDSPISGNVAANDTDADGDTLFVASGTYVTAQGGVVEIQSDGSFVYTPAANFHGIDSFQYTIRDSSESFSVGTVTIDVAAVNDDPIAEPDSFEGNEGDPILGNVLTNDSDIDSTTLEIVAGEFVTAAGGRVVLEADGTFSYTPIANFFGDDSFDYVLSDGDGGEAIGTVTLRIASVNDLPTIGNDSYSGDEDRTITGNVLDNDFDIDSGTLTVDAGTFGTAHGGSVVLQSDGSFVYTPAANYFGYDSFVYRVTDGIAEWGQGTVALSIAPVDDAPVATADAYTGDEDSPITGNVLDNDSDIDGETLTAIAETVTTDHGVSVSISAGGTFTYTPPTNYNGSDRFVYRLVNPAGDAISTEVVLTIRPVNNAPVAQDDAFSGNEDSAITGDVLGNDSDVDGDTLTVVPAETVTIGGGRVVLNQDGSFSYAPRANYNGSDLFTYRIRDGHGGEATATVRLTIAAVNDAPTAVNDISNGYEDFGLSGNVLVNDSDIDGDTLQVQAGTYATEHGGSISFQANGAFSYLPAANFNGDDHFVYTALDGRGGATQATLTLRLVPLNDQPIARNDTGSSNEDQPITGNVLANDTDADGDALTVTPITTTTIIGSRIVLLSNGSYIYTPAANFFGQESITYTISDGHFGTATAVLQFLVAPVNDAPIANDDSVNGVEDSIAFGSVLGNDTDIDGDVLQAQAGTLQTQQGGSVTIQSNGSFAYTPAANFNGDDRFTYTALDGHGGSAQATVTIRVSARNDNPVATDDAYSGDEDQQIEGNLISNDRDVDGDTLFATAGTVPTFAGGSVTIQANGNFVYAPAANFNGLDSFTYTISDGHGGTASATARLTISPVNDPPNVSPAHFTITENSPQGTLVGFVSANDVDAGQTLRYAILSNVDGAFLNPFVIDAATGAIRATQSLNYEAQSSYRFTVRVTDDGSPALSRDAEVAIDVVNVNETPTPADDRFTGSQGTTFGGNVLTNDTDPDGDVLSASPGTIATARGGSVILDANGSFLYTPPALFHGEDNFTYGVNDVGGLPAFATVRLTVRPAPTAVDDTYQIDEGRTLRANVRTNDSHPAGTPFTVVAADFVTARGASASIGSDGSLVYVPASAHYDTDDFTYELIDANGARAIGHVHIDVRNLPPTALLRQNFDPTAPTLTLSNATDAPEDASRGLRYAFDTDGDGVFDVGGDGTYAGSSTSPTLSLANLPPTTSATRTITARVIDADGGVTDYTVTYQNQGSLVAPSAPPVAVRNSTQQNAVVLNLESFAQQLPTGSPTNPQTYSIAYNTTTAPTTPTAFDVWNMAYTGTGTFEVAMPPNVIGSGGGVVPVLVRVTDTVTGITTDYQFFVVIPPAVVLPANDPVVVTNFDVKSFVGVTTIVKGAEDFGKRNESSEEDSFATEASSNKVAVVADVDKAAEVSVVVGNSKAVENVAFDMVLAEPPGPADSIVTYVGPLNNSPLVTSESDNVQIVIRLLDANRPETPPQVSNAGLEGPTDEHTQLASNTETSSTPAPGSPPEEETGGIWGWVRAAVAVAFAASCAGFFLWRRTKQEPSKIA